MTRLSKALKTNLYLLFLSGSSLCFLPQTSQASQIKCSQFFYTHAEYFAGGNEVIVSIQPSPEDSSPLQKFMVNRASEEPFYGFSENLLLRQPLASRVQLYREDRVVSEKLPARSFDGTIQLQVGFEVALLKIEIDAEKASSEQMEQVKANVRQGLGRIIDDGRFTRVNSDKEYQIWLRNPSEADVHLLTYFFLSSVETVEPIGHRYSDILVSIPTNKSGSSIEQFKLNPSSDKPFQGFSSELLLEKPTANRIQLQVENGSAVSPILPILSTNSSGQLKLNSGLATLEIKFWDDVESSRQMELIDQRVKQAIQMKSMEGRFTRGQTSTEYGIWIQNPTQADVHFLIDFFLSTTTP